MCHLRGINAAANPSRSEPARPASESAELRISPGDFGHGAKIPDTPVLFERRVSNGEGTPAFGLAAAFMPRRWSTTNFAA